MTVQLKIDKSFIGPNIYSPRPGLVLDFRPPESTPFEIESLGGDFHDNLAGPLERLQLRPEIHMDILKARDLGGLLAELALNLQRHAGAVVGHGRVLQREPSGRCHLIYECETSSVRIRAGALAGELIIYLLSLSGQPPPRKIIDPDQRLNELIAFVKDRGLHGDQRYIIEEARNAGIPAIYVGHKLLQLGHGRYRRRLFGTVTDATLWLAVDLATDKIATNRALKELGLPVSEQRVVWTPEQALDAVRAMGFPVVAKPRNQDCQLGVTIDIEIEGDLKTAFEHARQYGAEVLIEERLKGENYRIMVINAEIVSVPERQRAHMVGDGNRNVAELVDQLNSDPRRGHDAYLPFSFLVLNDDADGMLAAQGFDRSSVLKRGERAIISKFPSARWGDNTPEVARFVHPKVREAILLGVRALGLDIAGVDYIMPDIALAPSEAGGGILEINCAPLMQPHFARGPQEIARPIFNMLFPGGRPEYVPIVAICGEGRQPGVHEILGPALTEAGYVVGCATRDGTWVTGKQLSADDATTPKGARTLLQDPRIDAAIIETSINVVVDHGLGFDACDVAVIETPPEGSVASVQALELLPGLARRAVIIEFDHPLRDQLTKNRDAGDCDLIPCTRNIPVSMRTYRVAARL